MLTNILLVLDDLLKTFQTQRLRRLLRKALRIQRILLSFRRRYFPWFFQENLRDWFWIIYISFSLVLHTIYHPRRHLSFCKNPLVLRNSKLHLCLIIVLKAYPQTYYLENLLSSSCRCHTGRCLSLHDYGLSIITRKVRSFPWGMQKVSVKQKGRKVILKAE